ncbi:ribonuclease T2 [Heptranchias perlo]|uniref:ribonuclease T2 n=1 Tax=Heptranchias perlo TaxID=212740 RepID=UPI00355A9833
MVFQKGSGNQREPVLGWIFLPLLVAFILPETSHSTNHPWNMLILSHLWPQTVCLMTSDTCKVPPNVNYWTIHGLWPKSNEMCNNSWHFNINNVADILSELKRWWPDVIHPNSTNLWKHEWQKHGTCAASLESLDSQEKYFSKALQLYQKLDLNSALKKFNISPSSKYYMMEDIEKALVSVYGVIPKIQCMLSTQGVSVQTLGQIELCFSKDFQLLNCMEAAPNMLDSKNDRQHNTYSGFSVCDRNLQVYYPPIEHLY